MSIRSGPAGALGTTADGNRPLKTDKNKSFRFRSMTVLVVRSPAKAKTINKYLGADFRVLASYGHVRDLPSKDGSVRPDEDFDMSWEVDGKSKKRIDDIAKACWATIRLSSRPTRTAKEKPSHGMSKKFSASVKR